MISVVICSVDNAKFAQVEANLARAMGEEHEIIRIADARSMCEGYNRGVAHSRGDILVFCHDDIEVVADDLGKRLRRHLERCDVVGVAGTTWLVAAGWVVAGIPYIHGQIAYLNPSGGYDLYVYGAAARLVRQAQALDGLFFACRRHVAESVRFDAATFDGFHCYDVDFTFRAYLAGHRVAVACDIPLIHASGGSFNGVWQRYAEAFARKHQGRLSPFKQRNFQFAVINVQTKSEIMEVMRRGMRTGLDTVFDGLDCRSKRHMKRERLMKFNPIDFPQIQHMPRFLSGGSAWVEHIPFAWALLEMQRPQTLVELGTHYGDSYCAFCQGVAELSLPTKCTAVDTWRGDSHTGPYDDRIYTQLKAVHDQGYAGFSRLARMEFDAAVKEFAEGSVDLLHIDGLHTYEAVRHDFETWLPKMSPRGVVLFHDTAEKKGDFGVYRLFEEIKGAYPHFEFMHGHGLGILAVGTEIPESLATFFREASADPEPVRMYFAGAGRYLQVLSTMTTMCRQLHEGRKQLNAFKRQQGVTVPAALDAPQPAFENPSGYLHGLWREISEMMNAASRRGR